MSSQLTHTENADPGTSSLPLEVMISICLKTFLPKVLLECTRRKKGASLSFLIALKYGVVSDQFTLPCRLRILDKSTKT